MRTLSLILIAASLVACGASVNLAYQKRIADTFSASSGRTIGASEFVKPTALSEGQFAVYGMLNSDGKKSVMQNSVIMKDGNSWIIEAMTLSESAQSVMQYKVSNLDKAMAERNPDIIEIDWIKMKTDDSQTQVIDGAVLSLMSGMYRKGMGMWTASFTGATSGGAVTVPAGSFAGTTKASSKIEMMGFTMESTGWYSSSVPISGLVKSTDDDGNTMTLLDFGTSGAKSHLE